MLERLIRFIKYKILKIQSPSRGGKNIIHISIVPGVDVPDEELIVTVAKEMNKLIKWGWKVEKIEVNPYQYLNKTHYVTIYFKWGKE
jgi:hypothetical protein|nr:MAG TPA: hypothetical protein [Caudoviricetes sp.]